MTISYPTLAVVSIATPIMLTTLAWVRNTILVVAALVAYISIVTLVIELLARRRLQDRWRKDR